MRLNQKRWIRISRGFARVLDSYQRTKLEWTPEEMKAFMELVEHAMTLEMHANVHVDRVQDCQRRFRKSEKEPWQNND